MRFNQASILGITALLSGFSAPNFLLPSAHAQGQLGTQVKQRQLITPDYSECLIQVVFILLIDPESASDNDDIEFVCELEGKTFVIDLDNHQKQAMEDKLNHGELVSNETTLIFEEGSGIMMDDDMIHVPPGLEIALGKSDSITPTTSGPQGDWPVLVVRVTDKNGKVVPESTAQVGDYVFGTLGDSVNLKSQFSACSWGKLNIIPGDNKGKSDVPGVIDVTIPLALDDGHRGYTIQDSVTEAVEAKLGISMPGPYKQVMYVIENCYKGCTWLAFARDGWVSVYRAHFYKYSDFQMHEVGHNFGFAHSGRNGDIYGDVTCTMGYSNTADLKRCFNGAKNWQIGWYDDKKEIYVPSDENNIWSKRMVGIANYGNDPDNHPVIVKIETGTSDDYFVAFNRAAGPNEGNKFASDEVTIVRAGNNGESFSQSWLEATLHQGKVHIFSNWNGSGKDLTVTAEVIDITATVGYADVKICYGSCQGPPPPVCEDAPATFIFKKQRRDCKWVRDSSPDLCSVYKIKIMCPETCETCEYKCSDAAYNFLPYYPEKTTKWSCSKLSGVKNVANKKKNCALPNFHKTCRATCEPFLDKPTLINFDENGDGEPKPYFRTDLQLNNWYTVDGKKVVPGSGYEYGTISHPLVAFNGNGDPMTMDCPDGSFNLHSFYITPAQRKFLLVTLEGYKNGSKVATITVTLPSPMYPTFFDSQLSSLTDIDSLKFTTSRSQVAIDDMTVEIISPCTVVNDSSDGADSADSALAAAADPSV